MKPINLDGPTVALVIAALGNLVGLVWGAAKISGAVDRLVRWADKADHRIDNHETRIVVLETRDEDRR